MLCLDKNKIIFSTPFSILTKKIIGAEVNYTVTKKEFLVVVYAINKFQYYIIEYKVFIHNDHSIIRFLMNKPIVTSRVIRWLLLLQKFNIMILDNPGCEIVVVDFMSRLQQ